MSDKIENMEYKVISMREIQRNYKKILKEARKSARPVFLGAYGKPEAVLMDIKDFEKLQGDRIRTNTKKKWEDLRKELDYLTRQGEQNVDLVEFLRQDRQSH